MVLLCLATLSAQAAEVSCTDTGTKISARFINIESRNTQLELFVNNDDASSVSKYAGQCRSAPGAIELSLICNVMTSTDSGYEVRLYSTGGATLRASAKTWSMAGSGQVTPLKCDFEDEE